MATKPTADQVVTQKHLRAFVQRGGPRPTNVVRYAGADEQYLAMGDAKNDVSGGQKAQWAHDPRRRGGYRMIGMTNEPGDIPSATITFHRRHSGLTWLGGALTCPVNFYELAGTCTPPDNFRTGWDDFVTVYSNGMAGKRSHKSRAGLDKDELLADEIEFAFGAIYDLGAIAVGSLSSTLITRPIIDAMFGGSETCSNCGIADDGMQRLYLLQQSNGTVAANVVWSGDGGTTWAASAITGLAVATTVDAIAVAGTTLIVCVSASATQGYYISDVNPLTGAPGSWTFVTAGFAASSGPTDIYVAAPNDVYFSGKLGAIYRSTDLATGVRQISSTIATDLTRISGDDQGTIVAVGVSGGIVISLDRGATWATPLTALTGDLTALAVLDPYRYWVGNSAGALSATVNGGVTWLAATPAGITLINDIVVATDEVLHIAAGASATEARLLTTYDGGASWIPAGVGKRLSSLPVFNIAKRLALPAASSAQTSANALVIAGTDGAGTGGKALLGRANGL